MALSLKIKIRAWAILQLKRNKVLLHCSLFKKKYEVQGINLEERENMQAHLHSIPPKRIMNLRPLEVTADVHVNKSLF